jgi:hypothetical protein
LCYSFLNIKLSLHLHAIYINTRCYGCDSRTYSYYKAI